MRTFYCDQARTIQTPPRGQSLLRPVAQPPVRPPHPGESSRRTRTSREAGPSAIITRRVWYIGPHCFLPVRLGTFLLFVVLLLQVQDTKRTRQQTAASVLLRPPRLVAPSAPGRSRRARAPTEGRHIFAVEYIAPTILLQPRAGRRKEVTSPRRTTRRRTT